MITILSKKVMNIWKRTWKFNLEKFSLFNFLFELQASIAALNNDVEELKNIVTALGGSPTKNSVRALLPEYRLQSKDQSTKPTADRVQTTDELRSEAYEEAEAEELTASDADSLNIRQVELEQIRKALAKNKGNRKKAAEELGISDRTLYRRLKDL